MVKLKKTARIIHNPENEDILLDWYQSAGHTVSIKTATIAAKNGAVKAQRQLIID